MIHGHNTCNIILPDPYVSDILVIFFPVSVLLAGDQGQLLLESLEVGLALVNVDLHLTGLTVA